MDGKVSRISVDGLRSSDPTVLSVMIQDIINKPIDKLGVGTLCDLIALSEAAGLSKSLDRDLARFRDQMVREFNDIPAGDNLSEHLRRLAGVPSDQVPGFWRETVLARRDAAGIDERSVSQLDALAERFDQAPAVPITVSSATTLRVQHASTPERRANTGLSRNTATPAPRAKGKSPRAPRAPAVTRDPRRGEWIRDDVLSRLASYGPRGLKQAILVAGARHRAPWDDLREDEIVSVLRALLRDSRVRFSAGRWSSGSGAW